MEAIPCRASWARGRAASVHSRDVRFAANTLNLWPKRHSQRRAFRVFLSQSSGDRGKPVAAGAPGVVLRFTASRGSHQTLLALVLQEFRKPIRREGRVLITAIT